MTHDRSDEGSPSDARAGFHGQPEEQHDAGLSLPREGERSALVEKIVFSHPFCHDSLIPTPVIISISTSNWNMTGNLMIHDDR